MADSHEDIQGVHMATNNESMSLQYIKHTLQQALEGAGFSLVGFVECFQQDFQIKIDEKWEIHGVGEAEGRLSFQASTDDGETPLHFIVEDEKSQEAFKSWIRSSADWRRVNGPSKKTSQIFGAKFLVGLTHYVPGARGPAPQQLCLA